jgi:hypothetical protein
MTAILIYLVVAVVVFWIGMIRASIGVLSFAIFAALLAGLKIVGAIEWPWWLVLLPFWGAIGGAYVKIWTRSYQAIT